MKLVGWIYLFAYLVDGLMSMAAALLPSLEKASTWVSRPLVYSAIVFFVLGATGVLRPRRVFLILAGYYMLMAGCLMIPMTIAVFQRRTEGLPGEVDGSILQLVGERFAWFMPAFWALLVVQLALTAYGLVVYFRAQVPRPGEAPAAS